MTDLRRNEATRKEMEITDTKAVMQLIEWNG
jgi:hypothetical protein